MVNQTFSDAYMKEIDARKMVLKYEPILVIMWRDHRFRAKGANRKDLKPLGANIIKELWIPDLYITPRLHSSMTNKNSQCKYGYWITTPCFKYSLNEKARFARDRAARG